MSDKEAVLFICLGNICRSPIAEAVFLDLIQKKNLEDKYEVDSAALIDMHTGKSPFHMTQDGMKQKGVKYTNRAREITADDFNKFDVIFGMDDDNMEELKRRQPKGSKAQLKLLGEYDPSGERIIVDPYWEQRASDFVHVFEQCVRCCSAYLEKHPV